MRLYSTRCVFFSITLHPTCLNLVHVVLELPKDRYRPWKMTDGSDRSINHRCSSNNPVCPNINIYMFSVVHRQLSTSFKLKEFKAMLSSEDPNWYKIVSSKSF